MKAVYLAEAHSIAVKEVDEPVVGPSDVLLNLRSGGICGSDVHVYTGHHPFRKPPVVLGHEVAGDVLQIGADVTRLTVGDRVAVEPQISCGTCDFCAQGFSNLCSCKRVVGVHWPGMFSERIAAPEKVLYKLVSSTTYEEGAIIEPTAVAYRAFRTAEVGLGQTVAVLGVGAIGSLVALLCHAAHVDQLLVTDVKEYNLDLMRRLTECHAVNVARDSLTEAARRVTDGAGFDAVIVTSGTRSSFREALQLCRPRGIVAIISLYADEVSADLNLLVTREIQVRGSLTYTQKDFRDATALINSKTLDVTPLITDRVGIEEAPRIFHDIVAEGLDHVKVMLDLT